MNANTLLIGLSRQITLQRQMDVVANNVANITTDGFKRRMLRVGEHVMPIARADASPAGSRRISFVSDRTNSLDISGGAIERTGNPMDVAIRGAGFLVVETPAGERYTRNGALSLNGTGELVTSDGHRVLTDQGAVSFNPADGGITIAGDGTISTAQGVRGKLRLVSFTAPDALASEGRNLLSAREPAVPAGPSVRLDTGALERSNVSGVAEITRLLDISRAYTGIAQMMQRTDELRRTTLSRLADIT
jgi:flagellar basal-body rod protein FlgF